MVSLDFVAIYSSGGCSGITPISLLTSFWKRSTFVHLQYYIVLHSPWFLRLCQAYLFLDFGCREYVRVMRRSLERTAGVFQSGLSLHCQLPPSVEGLFIRAELSRPRISCICMITRSAPVPISVRIAPQWYPSLSLRFIYRRASRTSGTDACPIHPINVSLSCVPM